MKGTGWMAGGLVLANLLGPSAVLAEYTYPGSAAMQPLAVIEPVTEGTLFRTFRPTEPTAAGSLGASLDAYRIREINDDQDVITTVTGAWSFSPGWLAGLSLPYIVRDPEFNESDLLDMRLFVRRTLAGGEGSGFGLAGELTFIVPTAGTGDLYPFTLDTPVAGVRFAAANVSGTATFGLNLGYQSYLQTAGDSDSDLLYGLFVERPFSDRLTGVLEYAGSRHSHEGAAGSETVSDDYMTVGVHYRMGKNRLGASAGFGGGDSAADARFAASVVVPLGQPPGKAKPEPAGEKPRPAREKPEPEPSEPKAAPPAGPAAQKTSAVQVKVTNASGARGLGRKVAKTLGEKGYTVSGLTDPAGSTQARTVLLYPSTLTEQAISLARTLTFSRTLMDIQLLEARPTAGPPHLILIIGRDQVK